MDLMLLLKFYQNGEIVMAKYTYRCACGTTTTTTEKDAIKQVSQKAGVVPNYNPLGRKNGKKEKGKA